MMKPDSAFEMLIQCGISELQQGDFDAAVDSFSQALEQISVSVCAYTNRAAAYYAQENYENALNDLSRALELAPDLFSLYVNRGMIYRKIGEVERAAADFGQAIRLNPQQFWDCFDQMLILSTEYHPGAASLPNANTAPNQTQTQNDTVPSPAVYNLAGIVRPEVNKNIFKLFQSVTQFCTSLGFELDQTLNRRIEQDFFQLMIRLYDQFIARDPCNFLLYWDRGCLLSDAKQFEAAIADLNMAIHYSPTHPHLWLNRAVIHYRILDLARALDDMTRSIELDANANAYAYRAIILIGLKRLDQAKADLDLAIQLAPHHSILLNLRNSLTR